MDLRKITPKKKEVWSTPTERRSYTIWLNKELLQKAAGRTGAYLNYAKNVVFVVHCDGNFILIQVPM